MHTMFYKIMTIVSGTLLNYQKMGSFEIQRTQAIAFIDYMMSKYESLYTAVRLGIEKIDSIIYDKLDNNSFYGSNV